MRAASPAGLLTHPNTTAAPGQQAGIVAQNRFVPTPFLSHHRGIVLEVSSERPMTVTTKQRINNIRMEHHAAFQGLSLNLHGQLAIDTNH